jgi:hypothetical protein
VLDVVCRVDCRVGKGSADVDGGARNVIEASKASPRSADGVEEHPFCRAAIHAEHP